MCGIAGLVALDGSRVHPSVLQRMTDRLAHRGPDGEGFLLATAHRGTFSHRIVAHTREYRGDGISVGLGHRRLAILDLSDRGSQPMTTPDGRLSIVFNG